MIIRKMATLLITILVLSLSISCASKEVIAVQNADSILSGLIEPDNNTRVVNLTNKEIVSNIFKRVKWKEKTEDNGTKYIYATGKFIDIEQAKKNAYLTQLFFMVIFSEKGIDWGQADPIMYLKYMIGIKKTVDDLFLLGDTSRGIFKFNESGEIIEPKEKSLLFNFYVFIGYSIALTGIDKALDLPIIDNF